MEVPHHLCGIVLFLEAVIICVLYLDYFSSQTGTMNSPSLAENLGPVSLLLNVTEIINTKEEKGLPLN